MNRKISVQNFIVIIEVYNRCPFAPSGSSVFRVGKIESASPDIAIGVMYPFEFIEVNISSVICFKVVPGSLCGITNHPFCLLHITGFYGRHVFGILGRSDAVHCCVIPAVKCIIIDTYISAIMIHLHDIKKTHGLTACLLKAAAK